MSVVDLIEKGRISRFFPGRNNLIFPGAILHITQRAPGREPLFLEESDYLYMLYLLKNASKEFTLDIFSFTLMPNHLHLLLRVNQNNLAKSMQNLFGDYAKYFNRKYQRKGHVFCGRYRKAICFKDIYSLAASLYIHINSVKANLVKIPSQYRWSSCSLYTQPLGRKTFIKYEFILSILNEDLSKASKIYLKLLEEASKIRQKKPWQDPNALEDFKNILVYNMRRFFKFEDSSFILEDEIERKIEELKRKKWLRDPQQINARKYLIEQLKANGFSIKEIAKRLNLTRQSIYHTLNFT